MEIDQKEIAVVKQQTTKAHQAAEALVIANAKDMTSAADMLGKIKTVQKLIKTKKEDITKPLNEALRNVRSLFAPVEESADESERLIKGKMNAYQVEQDRIAREEEAKIQKQLDAGRIKPETAIRKTEAIAKPQTAVKGERGAVQFRTVRKVVIEDAASLPREYLIPDFVRIRKEALAGVAIAGVKVVEEKEVAAYGQAA